MPNVIVAEDDSPNHETAAAVIKEEIIHNNNVDLVVEVKAGTSHEEDPAGTSNAASASSSNQQRCLRRRHNHFLNSSEEEDEERKGEKEKGKKKSDSEDLESNPMISPPDANSSVLATGSSTGNNGDNHNAESNTNGVGIRRRKIRRRVSSSSSSPEMSHPTSPDSSSSSRSSSSNINFDMSDDDEDVNNNNDEDGEEEEEDGDNNDNSTERQPKEEEDQIPSVLSKPIPKFHSHSPLKDLIRREMYGFRGRNDTKFQKLNQFQKNRMGSLSLVERFELNSKLEGHDGCINSLHFNQSGNLLASGSDDLEIIVWDWQNQKKKVSFNTGHKSNVFQSKFLPHSNDSQIVSSSRDGQVRLGELSVTGVCRNTRKLVQHRGPANKIGLFSDSPHKFISGGEDGVVFSIDVREPKQSKLLVQKEDNRKVPIYSVDVNPGQEELFCTSGRDQFIRIYDRRRLAETNPLPLKKFCPHHMLDSRSTPNVTCAVFSQDGSEIIGSYNDEDIYLFLTNHSDGADYTKRYQGHRNNATVKGVNFYGPSSEFVISGSDCGNIFLWSKDTEAIVHMFEGDVSGVVNVLEAHPNLPYLATSGLDDDVKIWFPTAKNPIDRKAIEKAVKKNLSERGSERLSQSDAMDSQMLWVLLRQIRRTEERRARRLNGDAPSPNQPEDEESSEDSSDSDDESEGGSRGIQCQTS